jgi:hypothetical protein
VENLVVRVEPNARDVLRIKNPVDFKRWHSASPTLPEQWFDAGTAPKGSAPSLNGTMRLEEAAARAGEGRAKLLPETAVRNYSLQLERERI